MLKLDIGCGMRKISDDFIGIDKMDLHENFPDGKFIKCDIDKENLPFDDNSVDEIFCNQTLEHCFNLIHIMEEFHRVCKNGSIVKIGVPHEKSKWAWGDCTHVRAFNEWTFMFFTKGAMKGGGDYNIKADFDIKSIVLNAELLMFLDFVAVKPIRWELQEHFKTYSK